MDMWNNFCFIFLSLLSGCLGSFPQPVDVTTSTRPEIGCAQDVLVSFKNKTDKLLYMYYIEVVPGTHYVCDNLKYHGTISPDNTDDILIHKGKTMNIIFATSQEGKCSFAHRKFDTWLDCTKATNGKAFFDVPE